jgi:RNA methyltransferase, TrmH family
MADITSSTNSRIKLARKLQRKRHRDQTGLCLLEGLRLVQDAWEAGATFESVFVEEVEEAELNHAGAAFVQQLQDQGTPLFTVTPEVMSTITETISPQGIVAIAQMAQLAPPEQPLLLLVLDQLRDPGNVGTLLRSAAAAGVEWLLFAPGTVDPYNDKVLRSAMGAHYRLPIQVCADWQELSSLLEGRAIYVADADASLAYDEVDWNQPAALIVGGEANGPSDAAERLATTISIPMQPNVESLNVAVAGSIILFEAVRQRRNAGLG